MAFSFTKNLAAFSLALGLAGGALVAIPAAPASAAPSTTASVVQQESAAATLKGGRVNVHAFNRSSKKLLGLDSRGLV